MISKHIENLLYKDCPIRSEHIIGSIEHVKQINAPKEIWEKTSMLDKLTDNNKEILSKWYNEIDFDLIQYKETKFLIFPTLRRILEKITNNIELSDSTKNEILSSLDVIDIIIKLNKLCNDRVYKKYSKFYIENFPKLDYETELCANFSNTYVENLLLC